MTTRIQQTISPIDGALYLERPLASSTQIDRTLVSAVTAQEAWRRTPVAERVRDLPPDGCLVRRAGRPAG
jgi:acyl-CoA reductase-like NAD-dependent aldehyde dehydrogenase